MKLETIVKFGLTFALTTTINAKVTVYRDIEGFYDVCEHVACPPENKEQYKSLTNRCFQYGSGGILAPKNMREVTCSYAKDAQAFGFVRFFPLEYKGNPHIPVQEQVPSKRSFEHAPRKRNSYIQPENKTKKEQETEFLINLPLWIYKHTTQILVLPIKPILGEELFEFKK